ncbi:MULTISPECIES: hypothetical protein [unclassified Amycolatopsis]|uniref:hypothetical protein n=1 Tax=unclassified Amycolatopsis TaxID=2618356 RepID=UPI00287BAD17|nr:MULTISPECIES: hypothetical protein [unclassified Amycolatopsis]
MLRALAERIGRHPRFLGRDPAPWDNGTHFTRPGLADTGNVVAIHPWTSFSGTLATDPLGAVATHNAERLIQVAQAYATDPARRVRIQEDGAAPSIHFSDATRPRYGEWLSRSIRNAAASAHT